MDWLMIFAILVCTAAMYALVLLGYLHLRRRTAAAEGILLTGTVLLSVCNYLFAMSGSEKAVEFLEAAGPAYAGLSSVLRAAYMTFGGIAFAGIPGEPFSEIGRMIREGSPFPLTCTCCLTNGSFGYYANKQAVEEGGYDTINTKLV